MENLNLISMSAVRSAMKVIYTPAITLARPIGLRNDPHTATILHMGSQFRTDFEGAVAQMTPFERRDFEQWQQSAGGVAFHTWSDRAFAMAAALQIVEEAFAQDEEEEAPVDPTLQRMVNLNWSFETHGQWLLIVAFMVGFLAFFSTGGLTGPVASTIRLIAGVVAAILVLAWIGTKLMPSAIAVRARRVGVKVPEHHAHEEEAKLPIWQEEHFTSSAKILNYANWLILAQPGPNGLMDLHAPIPMEPTSAYNERQIEILNAAKRFRENSPMRSPGNN
ncbi:hypothetical protein [Gleimia europaea]|uniref:Uncharacterized protein n=1 Tax=Gleimia europaea ACS-120-V-Col10b TaxID=883069 RepID=A0A9W5RE56_9ACTO|nr:hypothetical protein [Gleimia europaea]EPD30645.1 hypothetical protein HMPREF9238_00393 [Gleimia europaea ACS-120-V-Col10b]